MAKNQLREELLLVTDHFDRNIDKVVNRINKLEKKSKDFGGGFNSSFKGMGGGLDGIISKLGGARLAMLGFGGAVTAAGAWITQTANKGAELAERAEGIRLAFARLNKPDLLDELNRATHNTISNLELMKQAVKFKDFNLNIEQMGTYLAFAQQKAKDTGESIDYLVNSIVTGLGRQSLMILDNLGLSAAEIKAEMKKGGDMTTAVANIIKKRMAESGDYVETFADRTARKEKEINDALEEMGRNIISTNSSIGDFFHNIELYAIKAISYIGTLLNQFSEIGRITEAYKNIGGDKKVDEYISKLGNGKGEGSKKVYEKQKARLEGAAKAAEQYIKDTEDWEKKRSIAAYDRKVAYEKRTGVKTIADARARADAFRQQLSRYETRANALFNQKPYTPTPTDENKPKGKQYGKGLIGQAEKELDHLKDKLKNAMTTEEITALNEKIREAEQYLKQLNAEFEQGSVADYNSQISNLRTQLEATADPANRQKLQTEIDTLEDLRDKLLYPEGSEDDLEHKLSRVTDELKKSVDPKIRADLEKLRRKLEDAKNALQFPKGSIGSISYEISKLNNELQTTLDEATRIKDILGIQKLQAENSLINTIAGSIGRLNAELSNLQAELNTATDPETVARINKQIKDTTDEIARKQQTGKYSTDKIEKHSAYNTEFNTIKTRFEIGEIDFKTAKREMKNINAKMKEEGLATFDVDIKPRLVTNIQSSLETFSGGFDVLNSIDGVVQSMERLNELTTEGANSWKVFIGIIQTVQTTLSALSAIIETVTFVTRLLSSSSAASAAAKTAEGAAATSAAGAETAEAAVKTASVAPAAAATVANKALEASYLDLAAAAIFAAHAAMPLVGVGLATGFITEMLATQATVHATTASLQAFADGGIVQGTSYSGDRLLARVNSGEMILNGFQQKNLFDLLDGKGGFGSSAGEVHFKIKGSDLYGTLKNYGGVKSYSGRNIGIK